MQLIYTDESGINYSASSEGIFKDGPYIIYGGICIDEKKYFHLERLFIELIKVYFSIDNWKSEEIHASKMWRREGNFSKYTNIEISSFFNDVLQILVKLDIQTIIGLQRKSLEANNEDKKKEESQAIYSYIHGIERYLSRKSETGIIIADQKQNVKDALFTKIFNDRSDWRIPSNLKLEPIITSKFDFESRLCFLLDNIHYVNSRDSLFIQVTDIVLFLIMRVWTYQTLRIDKPEIADLSKVPVEKETFFYFVNHNLNVSSYNSEKNDVEFENVKLFIEINHSSDPNQILPDVYFT